MHNLEPLINEARDIINKLDISPDVLNDRATKMKLCSCLDVIVDTECCLGAFTNTDTNIEQLDVGDKYMYVYGTLQALYMQQDAVKNFTDTLGIEYPSDRTLKRIREIRNDSVGHPSKRGDGEGKAFNFITRDSIGNQGFELGTAFKEDGRPDCFKRVDIPRLIEEQRNVFALFFGHVIGTFGKKRCDS